ncbi:MAG TPA: efflux RND transporter periplasmic adaptor subunit [Pirellulales bacterium]|jgi:cobalt-zinc-cadmium efflux system membrane fusion protein|nr:efflux RND transporter periplasmic adaptor subunit [Pirellulales bacterium]
MVQFAGKRLRDRFVMIAVAAAALGSVALVWMMVPTHRPAHDMGKEVAVEAGDDETREPTSVRLDRAELRAAAGIEVAPVETRPVDSTISCNGAVGFNQNRYVKVPPKAEGILREVNVDVGSTVHDGEVLAVVNSQVAGDLKASYLKAMIHESHLRWQLKQYRTLSEQQAVAVKNLVETEHQVEEQVADTARYRERLVEFGYSAEQVEQITQTHDISVQLPVMAPREGVVVERQAVVGEPAHPQTPLFAIADLESMWLHLHVYESFLPHIALGQSVTFFPDGLPGQGFAGTVTWISPEVDSQTRTIQLRAEVANPEGALRANMFGKAELLAEKTHDRLVVPPAAVQSHGGKHIVFVQKPDNLFEVRRIIVGLKSDQFWEVTAGLQAGEKVATTGSFLLKSNLENSDFGKVE